MTELKITKLPDNCITLFTNREFFGHGREMLLTREAQIELMDFLWINCPDEMGESMQRHMP